MHNFSVTLNLLIIFQYLLRGSGQYKAESEKFNQELTFNKAQLVLHLKSGEYVKQDLLPEKSYYNTDIYRHNYPHSADYTIGLLVDPCKDNSHNCCMGRYGAPEYRILKNSEDSGPFRVVSKVIYASLTDTLHDVDTVDENRNKIDYSRSRLVDDETTIDYSCLEENVPHRGCIGFGQRQQRSHLLPPCMDNNETVNGLANCTDAYGFTASHCLSVAISQTAVNVVCGGIYENHPHCGTFLEVHMPAMNNYAEIDTILGERRISILNMTGYVTTTLPMTWKKDSLKVLCNYKLDHFYPGAPVLISTDAPRCCLPKLYNDQLQSMHGAFMCPRYNSKEGPFAKIPETVEEIAEFEASILSYPYCPQLEDNFDALVIGKYSYTHQRYYTRPADPLNLKNDDLYYSTDLDGAYENVCPYFSGAGQLTDDVPNCIGSDVEFSFSGYTGFVVEKHAFNNGNEYTIWVSFNDGRTSYPFASNQVILDLDHNYEIWWVQRAKSEFIVQKRKPFYVAEPMCTFNAMNDEYFPYAMLDSSGNPVA